MIGISSTVLLDWDSITINEVLKRVSRIKDSHLVKSVEIRMSPLDGYHIYIGLFDQLHERIIFRLRRRWKDDGRRLMMDVFWRDSNGKDNSNIMFVKKMKFGVFWSEIPLFLYHRDDLKSIWKQRNLQD